VSGAATQTLTQTLSTGTLAAGATQNVTVGSLNMSAAGTYTFALTATVAGDQNTANDALAAPATRTVVAPVAGTIVPSLASICVGGTATLTLTGAANGSVQWQQSTDNVTFTDISGATSASYTSGVLTSTTYFRARTSCNAAVATSNVATITITNPQVASTNSPLSICAGSTATLTATATAGNTVRFFSAATGGTALATTTAGSYTTPALTASTTYYAEAFTTGSRTAGLSDNSASNGTFSQSSLTDYPLGFAVTQAGTLTSVDVYPTAAGTLTIRLYSVAGTQPGGTATAVAGSNVTITVTAAQVGTRVTVPLNYALTAGDYKLSNATGALGRYTSYTGTYPLVSADGVLSVKGSYSSATSTTYSNTTYNSFFNLTFSSECVNSTRTAIQVNVTPGAAAGFSYPATGGNCAGSTGTVAATLASGATAGTFTSTTGLTLDAATGAVNLATSTAGTYTVTNTVAATGAGSCPGTATATITVNPTPAQPTLTATYNGTQTTLTSSAATGNQFYFNGSPIAGATGQSYVVNGSATTYGPYTVVVTNSFGCASPASVATVVTTTRAGIAGASVRLYPNPTPNGQVTLEMSGFRSATQLAVVDALGRVVRSQALPATTGVASHGLDLSGVAPGVYLLRLTNADGVETRRLVRE
ncbi:MAG TPA: T9SS type A sorting domain-containing protein, partial [Hymenobacter sp.]|uniref:Ig-like domain-containing protein n=1 Tax=Hymenobacter sp. TaxID=1898978 RepID=UPI002D80A223